MFELTETEDSDVDRWIVDPGSVVPGQLHTSLVAEHLTKINDSPGNLGLMQMKIFFLSFFKQYSIYNSFSLISGHCVSGQNSISGPRFVFDIV